MNVSRISPTRGSSLISKVVSPERNSAIRVLPASSLAAHRLINTRAPAHILAAWRCSGPRWSGIFSSSLASWRWRAVCSTWARAKASENGGPSVLDAISSASSTALLGPVPRDGVSTWENRAASRMLCSGARSFLRNLNHPMRPAGIQTRLR